MQNFFYRFGSLFYLFFGAVLLSGCAGSSAVVENDNTGLYSSTKNPVNRITINDDSSRDLYTIQLNNTDGEWEGVGFERDTKIVAVLRDLEDEDAAGFLNISFPGNDQLFVVTRNTEGEYLRDEY